MFKIKITSKLEGFYAYIDGSEELCGLGRTPLEAIGNLIVKHGKNFNFIIEDSN